MNHVWIGLRADGVELMRQEVACIETGRSNGIASHRIPGTVIFPDLPVDCYEPTMTLHEGPDGAPFATRELDYQDFRQGDNLNVADVTFKVPLDVPKYQRPEGKPRKRRVPRIVNR